MAARNTAIPTRPRARRRAWALAATAGLAGSIALAGSLGDAGRGRTGEAVRVERAPSAVVWIGDGDFEMGADRHHIRLAVDLCAREPGVGTLAARECLGDQFPLDQPPCDLSHVALEYGAHRVWLRAFGIDRTEVTVAAYDRCVVAGACRPAPLAPGAPRLGAPAQPMVMVRWFDADDYCRYRHGRLPTEAEWERAARGRDGRPFPWGWTWDPRRANHGSFAPDCADAVTDGFEATAPVGSYPDGASPDGLLDVAGNASEWVEDFAAGELSVYPRAPDVPEGEPEPPMPRVVDPRGPSHGGARIVRGGGFDSAAFELRVTYRAALGAGARSESVGFRCAYDR